MKNVFLKIVSSVWMACSAAVLILWQLPQMLVGAVVASVAAGGEAVLYRRTLFFRFRKDRTGSVSFGPVVILDRNAGESIRKHEYGHCVQSMLLGPLYLIVIGLPSLIHACFHKDSPGHGYMDFFTEKWANRLAEKFYK